MKKSIPPKFLASILSLSLLVSSCTYPSGAYKPSEKVTFECGEDQVNGSFTPTTFANNNGKKTAIIHWDRNNKSFGDTWTPQKRCETVSQRFQELYDRDAIAYLTADEASWNAGKGYNVICGVKQKDVRCEKDDLLFTLENKDDPNEVLEKLIAIRTKPDENKPLLRGEDNFKGGRRVYYNFQDILGSNSTNRDSNSNGSKAF